MFVLSVFVVVGVSTMTSMGESPMMMFVVCFTAIGLFYIAHWQTFVSGEPELRVLPPLSLHLPPLRIRRAEVIWSRWG